MEKNYSKVRNKKGITLVALIITIIVLLIIAAVTLIFVFGEDGIIERTKKSAFVSQMRTYQEQAEIYIAQKGMESVENETENTEEPQAISENGEEAEGETEEGEEEQTQALVIINVRLSWSTRN